MFFLYICRHFDNRASMQINHRLSIDLAHANVLMTILIVAMHTSWDGEPRLNTLNVLTNIAVPTFFCISSFLYFYNWQPTWQCYVAKIRSRVYSLLIPYLAYNILFYIYYLVKIHLLHLTTTKHIPTDLLGAIGCILSGEPDGVMWYVRDLMVFVVVIAPLLGLLLRHSGWWILPLLATGAVCCLLPYYNILFWIPCLSLGAWTALYLPSIAERTSTLRRQLDGNRWAGTVVLLVLVCVTMYLADVSRRSEVFYAFRMVAPLFIVLLCLTFDRHMPVACTQRLAPLCFFVYCTHTAFVDIAKARLLPLLQGISLDYRLTYAVMLVAVLCSVMLAALFVRRCLPPIWTILSGHRKERTFTD